jgi:protein-S-isoprenylcysteine O-methyltransferase Ste14
MLIAGIPLSHITSGSWLAECGFVNPSGVFMIVVWSTWWVWGFIACARRAQAEDAQLRKVFGEKWDEYAERVPCWFVPGLL